MKHGEGKEGARELYIYEQCTFDEIAARIGRSDKTVREWAKEEDWKGQREKFLKGRYATHDKLQTLVNKVCDRLSNDYDLEEQINPMALHALTKLVNAMKVTYDYDNKAKVQQTADAPRDTSDGLSAEAIDKIESQLNFI